MVFLAALLSTAVEAYCVVVDSYEISTAEIHVFVASFCVYVLYCS
jgi:hypothetical protein